MTEIKKYNVTVFVDGKETTVEEISETEIVNKYGEKYLVNGYFIGEESKKWITENMKNYMLIDGRIEANSNIYNEAVMFQTKEDAAMFRLVWK